MVNLAAYKPYIIVPLYLYPSPGAWQPLYDQISGNPDVNFQIIVNPSDGPGTAVGAAPEQNWIDTMATLNSKPNVNTVGYVHVSWCARDAAEITSEIDAYASWSSYPNADIHVGGIFFDEAPDNDAADMVSYMNDVSSHARLQFKDRPSSTLVYNPGCPVPAVYYEQADIIVTFEDVYDNYSGQRTDFPLSAMKAPNKHKSAFIINDFTGSLDQQNQIIADLTSYNITGLYISNYNDYTKMPDMWPQLSSQIASYSATT